MQGARIEQHARGLQVTTALLKHLQLLEAAGRCMSITLFMSFDASLRAPRLQQGSENIEEAKAKHALQAQCGVKVLADSCLASSTVTCG